MTYFRAVAVDLDGTLTVADQVSPQLLEAIDRARPEHAIVLVTGRVMQDLARVFPGLTSHFDAVVSENGAVLTTGTVTRDLHEPVDGSVDNALADRGVGFGRGRVLVAIAGRDGGIAAEVIAAMGLDYQVVHNRAAAMILPSGITKGTGLHAALETLGLSEHNAIAVGDAENDLSLLHAAEVGAAVADAVPSLAERADLVLDQPDGQGVIGLLGGPLLAGSVRLCPVRHWVPIGVYDDDGAPARVPGSQAGILVTGETGSGKSFVAGLLAERWIEAGYSVLVIDPEGDHVGLSERSGVHLVDAVAGLPAPHDLLALLRSGPVSVVLDLSGVAVDEQLRYLQRLPGAIAAERVRHGRPHWVIYDEAHQQAWLDESSQVAAGPGGCLATWRPELLPDSLTRGADVVITTGPSPTSGERPRATLTTAGETRPFQIDRRASSHVRHQHKYATTPLPAHRRFYFREQDPTSAAATVEEFRHTVSHADSAILDYHLGRGDFSRWVSGTLADRAFADELARIESEVTHRHADAVERAREEICRAIERRYLRA